MYPCKCVNVCVCVCVLVCTSLSTSISLSLLLSLSLSRSLSRPLDLYLRMRTSLHRNAASPLSSSPTDSCSLWKLQQQRQTKTQPKKQKQQQQKQKQKRRSLRANGPSALHPTPQRTRRLQGGAMQRWTVPSSVMQSRAKKTATITQQHNESRSVKKWRQQRHCPHLPCSRCLVARWCSQLAWCLHGWT